MLVVTHFKKQTVFEIALSFFFLWALECSYKGLLLLIGQAEDLDMCSRLVDRRRRITQKKGRNIQNTAKVFEIRKMLLSGCGVPRGGGEVVQTPLEFPKAHQNLAKLNPTVKTVKNC